MISKHIMKITFLDKPEFVSFLGVLLLFFFFFFGDSYKVSPNFKQFSLS